MAHVKFLAFVKKVKVLTVILCISLCVAACTELDMFVRLIQFLRKLLRMDGFC